MGSCGAWVTVCVLYVHDSVQMANWFQYIDSIRTRRKKNIITFSRALRHWHYDKYSYIVHTVRVSKLVSATKLVGAECNISYCSNKYSLVYTQKQSRRIKNTHKNIWKKQIHTKIYMNIHTAAPVIMHVFLCSMCTLRAYFIQQVHLNVGHNEERTNTQKTRPSRQAQKSCFQCLNVSMRARACAYWTITEERLKY